NWLPLRPTSLSRFSAVRFCCQREAGGLDFHASMRRAEKRSSPRSCSFGTDRFPTGRVGFYATAAAAEFDLIELADDTTATEFGPRWASQASPVAPASNRFDDTTGRLHLERDRHGKGMRLLGTHGERFELVFAIRRESAAARVRFNLMFNV